MQPVDPVFGSKSDRPSNSAINELVISTLCTLYAHAVDRRSAEKWSTAKIGRVTMTTESSSSSNNNNNTKFIKRHNAVKRLQRCWRNR